MNNNVKMQNGIIKQHGIIRNRSRLPVSSFDQHRNSLQKKEGKTAVPPVFAEAVTIQQQLFFSNGCRFKI